MLKYDSKISKGKLVFLPSSVVVLYFVIYFTVICSDINLKFIQVGLSRVFLKNPFLFAYRGIRFVTLFTHRCSACSSPRFCNLLLILILSHFFSRTRATQELIWTSINSVQKIRNITFSSTLSLNSAISVWKPF